MCTSLLLAQALEAALAFKDAGLRAEALGALAGQLEGARKAEVMQQALEAAVKHLLVLKDHDRRTLLEFLATRNLFVAPYPSQDVIAGIVHAINEICTQWTWL